MANFSSANKFVFIAGLLGRLSNIHVMVVIVPSFKSRIQWPLPPPPSHNSVGDLKCTDAVVSILSQGCTRIRRDVAFGPWRVADSEWDATSYADSVSLICWLHYCNCRRRRERERCPGRSTHAIDILSELCLFFNKHDSDRFLKWGCSAGQLSNTLQFVY